MLSLFAFHALYAQSGLGVGIVLVGLTASLAWTHRAASAPLFVAAASWCLGPLRRGAR